MVTKEPRVIMAQRDRKESQDSKEPEETLDTLVRLCDGTFDLGL